MFDRVLARVRARTLDERLLAGTPPNESAQMMARSAMLLEPGYRSAVAAGLRDAVEAAESGKRNFFRAQAVLREGEVLNARASILTLADEVEQDQPLNPQGVIMADRLIRDGESPVFWPSQGSVESAVKEARAGLALG